MMAVDTMASETGIIACKVQSMQLPEELGTVNHIFSDKTGTLTKNELIFRKLSTMGKLFECETSEQLLKDIHLSNSETSELLFKCFCICNDVYPITVNGKVVLSGTSQDELVMLEVSSKSHYYTLHKRDSDAIYLKNN